MSNPAVFDDSDKDDKDFILGDYCDICQKLRKGNMKSQKVAICPMPERYCHIRSGERKVHEEIYTVIHLLSSNYHMSKQQIEGSIVTFTKMLLDIEWKP